MKFLEIAFGSLLSLLLSDVGGQTAQIFLKATAKVLSHPALTLRKAFFEIGKAFRVTGVYGLSLSLSDTYTHKHTQSLPTLLSFSENPLEPRALAYLLCIMGCSVPEDWLG